MIAAWLLYCTLCAAGLSVAAVVAERTLLAGRGPVRHVWLGAVALSMIVPIVAFRYAPRPAPQVIANSNEAVQHIPVVDLPNADSAAAATPARTAIPPSSTPTAPTAPTRRIDWRGLIARADQPLMIAWISMSLALALHLVFGLIALGRMRRAWRPTVVQGVQVFVSERTGPALVGAMSPSIVVPEWALTLNAAQLALMLRHEQEHQRAHDGRLLFAAQFALIAMPWNLALWWQLLQLRVAVELDCDARVLRDADARSYGDLLLEVVRPRPTIAPAGATAFAEKATQLERRIRVMARPRHRVLRGARAVAAFVAFAAVTIAWIAPRPPAPARTADPAVVAPDTQLVSKAPVVPPKGSATPRAASNAPEKTAQPIVTGPESALAAVPVAAAGQPVIVPPRTDSVDAARAAGALPPLRLDSILGGAGRGGRGLGTPEQTVTAIFTRLFEGITLAPDQEARARDILLKLVEKQRAQVDSTAPARAAFAAQQAAIRARRDSTLIAIVTSDSDRTTLSGRLTVGRGGARGGGGGGRGGRGGGTPDSLNAGRGGDGGRGGSVPPDGGRGNARGGGGGRSGAPPAGPADSSQLVQEAFSRFFDGITLTPDQEARARNAIARMQSEQRALVPPAVPQVVALRPPNTVLIEAKSDSALVAVLTNEADRQKLRSRIVIPTPAQPPP